MRDLVPIVPGLGAAPLIFGATASTADVPGLVADVERRFAALEAHCDAVGDVPTGDAEFYRLHARVAEAVEALADAPARSLADLVVKARALTSYAAIEERVERVGFSVAFDLLRLLAAAPP